MEGRHPLPRPISQRNGGLLQVEGFYPVLRLTRLRTMTDLVKSSLSLERERERRRGGERERDLLWLIFILLHPVKPGIDRKLHPFKQA